MYIWQRDRRILNTLSCLSDQEEKLIKEDEKYKALAMEVMQIRDEMAYLVGLDQMMQNLSYEERVIFMDGRDFQSLLQNITPFRCFEILGGDFIGNHLDLADPRDEYYLSEAGSHFDDAFDALRDYFEQKCERTKSYCSYPFINDLKKDLRRHNSHMSQKDGAVTEEKTSGFTCI